LGTISSDWLLPKLVKDAHIYIYIINPLAYTEDNRKHHDFNTRKKYKDFPIKVSISDSTGRTTIQEETYYDRVYLNYKP